MNPAMAIALAAAILATSPSAQPEASGGSAGGSVSRIAIRNGGFVARDTREAFTPLGFNYYRTNTSGAFGSRLED